MKFTTYTATPGLERFPENERYGAYRSAFKRLMREDRRFRERIHRFKLSILVATALLSVLCGPLLLRLNAGAWQSSLELAAIVITTVSYLVYVLVASIRIQEFQNEQIGILLQGPDA